MEIKYFEIKVIWKSIKLAIEWCMLRSNLNKNFLLSIFFVFDRVESICEATMRNLVVEHAHWNVYKSMRKVSEKSVLILILIFFYLSTSKLQYEFIAKLEHISTQT